MVIYKFSIKYKYKKGEIKIFKIQGIKTEIISASIRNPIHVTDCALAGVDIATVPYIVIENMTKHPLTDQGIAKFQKDYINYLENRK